MDDAMQSEGIMMLFAGFVAKRGDAHQAKEREIEMMSIWH